MKTKTQNLQYENSMYISECVFIYTHRRESRDRGRMKVITLKLKNFSIKKFENNNYKKPLFFLLQMGGGGVPETYTFIDKGSNLSMVNDK